MRAPRAPVRGLAAWPVAAAFVILVGSACSGSESTTSKSTPGSSPHVAATVPPPGATPANPPPDIPARGPSMPPDTVDLVDLYRQGKADVVR